MTIILFNNYQNGDLFLTKEFVRNLVISNPTYRFELYINFTFSIFRDIPNLNIYNKKEFNNIKAFIDQNTWYIYNGDIYLNTWCRGYFDGMDITKFYDLFKSFALSTNLKFNDMAINDMIPQISSLIDMNKVYSIINTFDVTKTVFIYNLQGVSCTLDYDHDYIIKSIALKYPEYTILVAKKTPVVLPNVTSLDTYDIYQGHDVYDYEGSALLYYGIIASMCSIVITRECGATFFVFNSHGITLNNKQDILFIEFIYNSSALSKMIANTNKRIIFTDANTINTNIIPLIDNIIISNK